MKHRKPYDDMFEALLFVLFVVVILFYVALRTEVVARMFVSLFS